ncbi:MAG: hypothetical protein IJI05_01875 [Erysipelotrichaceae bacterium]|nr:hypothetical protein [Erysipelotrichaceae bacterium]
MIRKLLVVITILMMLAGCGNREKVAFVAILEKTEENSAAVAFADKEGKMIFSKEIEIPAEVYFGDEAVYYSKDYITYDSVEYATFKSGDTLNDVPGFILYHLKGGFTVLFSNDVLKFMKDGKTVKEYSWQGTSFTKAYKGKLYVNDDIHLRIFSLEDGELLEEKMPVASMFSDLTEIDGRLYMATDYGFMDLEEGTVYVYPRIFESIISCRDNVLTVSENGEICKYYVSIAANRMELKDDFDDEIKNIDFEEMFPEWYEKGYEVVFFENYQ